MAHRLGLREAWQTDWAGAFQPAQPRSTALRLIEIDAGRIGAIHLEDQRLLEHQRPVTGQSLHLTLLVRRRGRPPARRICGHRTTSRSAASNAAMSSPVTVSVTATTSPF